MASSLNKVMIIGNLGKDPEVRYMPSGGAVATFSMAVSESWTDKQGQRQERTEWVRTVAFGKTAELCGEYLAKGRQVFVEGRLQTREYQDRDNNKRYMTEVVANNVQFLGSRGDAQGGGGGGGGQSSRRPSAQPQEQPSGQQADQGYDYGPPPSDDDVPF